MMNPSSVDEIVDDIRPVSSEIVIVHPRPFWPPCRMMLPFRRSRFLMGDSRPSRPPCRHWEKHRSGERLAGILGFLQAFHGRARDEPREDR
jgi:hypothetical protein